MADSYFCPLCNFSGIHIPHIMGHLKLRHPRSSYGVLKCRQGQCTRHFGDSASFRKHLLLKHHQISISIPANIVDDRVNNYASSLELSGVEEEPAVISLPTEQISIDGFRKVVNDASLRFMGGLYCNPYMNRTVIQEVIESAAELLSPIACIREKLKNSQKHEIDPSELGEMLAVYEHSFDNLMTDYRRDNFFESSEWLIRSVAFVIGTASDAATSNGLSHMIIKDLTAQMIPMRCVLQRYLELPGIFEAIVTYMNKQKGSVHISHIVGTKLWNDLESEFKDKLLLPLIIYFDDFEVNNPLGTHTGVNKIGAVYFRIAAIPPEYSSMTENILLAQLHNSVDRSTFGNDRTFDRLIQELIHLQTNGIMIHVNNEAKQVYFVLTSILGDNAGLHSLLGFNDSFSSTYSCRFCRVDKTVSRCQLKEDRRMVRTKRNYEADLISLDRGIKEGCVFHEIPNFHLTVNLYADIMHDLLEGICRYDMANILHRLITVDKLLTLSILNNRIKYFQYGNASGGQRLPELKSTFLKSGTLILSASEMLRLVQLLGLIIGDLIPINNETWTFYNILRSILCILLNPSVEKNEVKKLRSLISEHHLKYQNLFDKHLKPKHHFLIHYPRILEQVGPLWNISCMRFEGKHKELKVQANNTRSRKNICCTLAHRHQLTFSQRLAAKKGFERRIKLGPGTEILLTEHYQYNLYKNSLHENLENLLFKPKWVEINGTLYKNNMIVIIGKRESHFEYGKIAHILVNNNSEVFFLLILLNTLSFSQHYHSFIVAISDKWYCVKQTDLLVPKPLQEHSKSDGVCYVPCR